MSTAPIRQTLSSAPLPQALDRLLAFGLPIYSLAIIGLGLETLLYAGFRSVDKGYGANYHVVPVIPFLPQISWLVYVAGLILFAGGLGLLFRRTRLPAAIIVGSLMFLGAIFCDAPRYAVHLGDMAIRTAVFEPLSLAALAWLLPPVGAIPAWLERASRYLFALSLLVFGVDHFLALAPIGRLIPNWIPWHVFWIAFFGAGFIAAGFSIALDYLLPWGAACFGLMFAIWVFTLHLPRTLFGLSGGNGPRNPDEWSSLLIAVALWGGSWALARAHSAIP